jgi:transposase
MEIQLKDIQAETYNLDHHGIVAATFQDLGFIEKINKKIPNQDPRRIVSTGHAVLAMVLNGLGFTNRRLYLSPQFFASKPVERLFGNRIQAKNLDDHALGEALDEIAEYGASRFFGELAYEVGCEQNLFGKTAHIDSTSISVEGEYPEEPGVSVIKVTHGYSKDYRPDLKQVILNLCVTGPSDYPFFCEPRSGNSSDQKSFQLDLQVFKTLKF